MATKIYGINNLHNLLKSKKDAKEFALKTYGPGVSYILHSGLLCDGEAEFNSGEKLVTGDKK